MLGPLDVEKQFDIAKPRAIRMSIYDLASEIVHADGLIWNLANDPSESFGVFSYQNFLNRMIEVPIPVYLDVLNQVIRDKPEIWFQEEDITTGKIKRHAVTKREYAQPTKLTKPGGGSK